MLLQKLYHDLIDTLLPRTCIVCGRRLVPMEDVCCTACSINMPLTNYKACKGNPIERIFWGKIPIVRANAYMHYEPHSQYAQIITRLKYKNNPNIGIYLGRLIAEDLITTGFFEDIDFMIPLPLAWSRQYSRGYNQCEFIAKGIQQIIPLKIDSRSIKRSKANKKQARTHKSLRHNNVKDIFSLTIPCKIHEQTVLTPLETLNPVKQNPPPSTHPLANKHILLIDDIITTGATLLSCGKTLSTIPGIRISILCVGVAGHQRWGVRNPE